MDTAHYSVIRYMPDPGRGERLNIGVLLWVGERYQLRLDDDAIDRVVRENPRLIRDSLLYVGPMIREALLSGGQIPERAAELLARQRGFPVDLSEARFTDVASREGIDDALDALVERIVRPKRRGGGGRGYDPRKAMAKHLKPLLEQGRVERHHFFKSSGTGIGRAVDFFANSGANTALDVVKLALKEAKEIQSRADAEAFKVYDIRRENDIRFVVYCDFSLDRSLGEANDSARKAIESTGAVVVSNPKEAAGEMLVST